MLLYFLIFFWVFGLFKFKNNIMNSNLYVLKYIFISNDYLNKLDSSIKGNQNLLLKNLIENNIEEYIDKEKTKKNLDLSQYTILNKLSFIKEKYIFAQIIGRENIAEKKNNYEDEDCDNLDVIEKTEHKFLQGDDNESNKFKKIVWNFAFNDGNTQFFGFEYKEFNKETLERIKRMDEKDKFIKVIIGPNVEIRRGIFYLTKDNFRIID